jgi:hypothetical protein
MFAVALLMSLFQTVTAQGAPKLSARARKKPKTTPKISLPSQSNKKPNLTSSPSEIKAAPYRWELLVGPALVIQNYQENSGTSLGLRGYLSWRANDANSISLRHLGAIKSLSSQTLAAPQWTQLTWERHICLQSCSNAEWWIPDFYAVFGAERYTNILSATTTRTRYVGSYISPVIGFRTRFQMERSWEMGGDILINTLGNKTEGRGYKLHIQGDLGLKIQGPFTVGIGYWFERASIASQTIMEQTFAFESYLKYQF